MFLHFRSNLFLIVLCITLIKCNSDLPKNPKIAIAGLAIESSTFSPAKTEADAFSKRR